MSTFVGRWWAVLVSSANHRDNLWGSVPIIQLIGLILLYAGIHFCAYANFKQPVVLPDTYAFKDTAQLGVFNSDFYSGSRPFTVPLVYKVFSYNLNTIAYFQVALHVIVWPLLAFVTAMIVRTGIVKLLAIVVIFAVGLSPTVSEFNRVMLSESFSISLAALSISWTLLLVSSLLPSRKGLVQRSGLNIKAGSALAVLLIVWCFCHDLNSYFLLVIAGVCVISFALPGQRDKSAKLVILFAGIMLAAAVGSILLMNRAERWRFPLSNVVAQRILPYPDRLAYFQERGLNPSSELMNFSGKWAGSDGGSMLQLPEYNRWLSAKGKLTYAQFLLSYPRYTCASLVSNLPIIMNSDCRYLYLGEEGLRWQWIRSIEPIFLPRGNWASLIALIALGCFAVASLLWKSSSLSLYAKLLTCLFVGGGFQIFVAYHGDEMEIPRHTMVAVLLVRLATWLALLLFLDSVMQRRSIRSSQLIPSKL